MTTNVTVAQTVQTVAVGTASNSIALATHTALANPHQTAVADLEPGTLAQLNAVLSDADLDATTARRQPYRPVLEIAVTTILDGTSVVILADAATGSMDVTLPSAVTFEGVPFTIKKIDSSINTVTLISVDNIDGVGSAIITDQFTSLDVISDGTTWWIV